jgi:hypothetical protein
MQSHLKFMVLPPFPGKLRHNTANMYINYPFFFIPRLLSLKFVLVRFLDAEI